VQHDVDVADRFGEVDRRVVDHLAYDPAFTDIDPNKSVAARKELGLATTVPADEAEVWAG
ncbi:hypothetical protein ABT329_36300, partial [Streptomyces minutiscleroticus]